MPFLWIFRYLYSFKSIIFDHHFLNQLNLRISKSFIIRLSCKFELFVIFSLKEMLTYLNIILIIKCFLTFIFKLPFWFYFLNFLPSFLFFDLRFFFFRFFHFLVLTIRLNTFPNFKVCSNFHLSFFLCSWIHWRILYFWRILIFWHGY